MSFHLSRAGLSRVIVTKIVFAARLLSILISTELASQFGDAHILLDNLSANFDAVLSQIARIAQQRTTRTDLIVMRWHKMTI
jgi:hypothetical protein